MQVFFLANATSPIHRYRPCVRGAGLLPVANRHPHQTSRPRSVPDILVHSFFGIILPRLAAFKRRSDTAGGKIRS
jgi:hypothetical protein